MVQIINTIVFIGSSILFSLLYIISTQPARLEQRMGAKAYPFCRNLRIAASFFELITIISYIVYFFFPFNLPLLRVFPWPYWLSAVLGVCLLVPGTWLMSVGLRDAGREAISPKKEHTMFTGIYRVIRHPQAAGEVFAWPAAAFFLNSPFLLIIPLVWFPVFTLFCFFEEQDLLLRYGMDYAKYRKRVGMFFPRRKK